MLFFRGKKLTNRRFKFEENNKWRIGFLHDISNERIKKYYN